jgi:hypothetical protein
MGKVDSNLAVTAFFKSNPRFKMEANIYNTIMQRKVTGLSAHARLSQKKS